LILREMVLLERGFQSCISPDTSLEDKPVPAVAKRLQAFNPGKSALTALSADRQGSQKKQSKGV
jgi:hypothetical protein